MSEPTVVLTTQHYTTVLTALVSLMSLVIGALVMAAYHYWRSRVTTMETRQTELREKVIPKLVTKDDLESLLERVLNTFMTRFEAFMEACHSGECTMAVVVRNLVAESRDKKEANERQHRLRHPTRKEGA